MKTLVEYLVESANRQILDIPTRFVVADQLPKEMQKYVNDARHIIMNAPRPISGDYAMQADKGVSGLFFVAINMSGKDAAFHVKENLKAKPLVIYPVTQQELESIAIGPSKYRDKILKTNNTSAISMAVQKMKDVPYREADKLYDMYT